jgi:hypothetical protein
VPPNPPELPEPRELAELEELPAELPLLNVVPERDDPLKPLKDVFVPPVVPYTGCRV